MNNTYAHKVASAMLEQFISDCNDYPNINKADLLEKYIASAVELGYTKGKIQGETQ